MQRAGSEFVDSTNPTPIIAEGGSAVPSMPLVPPASSDSKRGKPKESRQVREARIRREKVAKGLKVKNPSLMEQKQIAEVRNNKKHERAEQKLQRRQEKQRAKAEAKKAEAKKGVKALAAAEASTDEEAAPTPAADTSSALLSDSMLDTTASSTSTLED